MISLAELRKLLHRLPELSGQEKNTSQMILSFLEHCKPDKIITGIGGYGIAAIFNGDNDGPRVMIRCELDALPIQESLAIPYCSEVDGVSHKCGHDGHMTIVAGLAERFHNRRPDNGSVMLLFQPAEETGQGARRVLDDDKFKRLNPDYVLALHNLPGFELGQVIIRKGIFASASIGLRIGLIGETAHAGEPERGISPTQAVCQLIQELNSIPQYYSPFHESAQITIVHVRVGEVAFGTSPGDADVMVTLRSHTQDTINFIIEKTIDTVTHIADKFGLNVNIDTAEPFPSIHNDSGVVKAIQQTAHNTGFSIHHQSTPFPWSEDFGHFTVEYRGALFGLGAGENHPALHHPDYDFPDDLIEPGTNLLESLIYTLQDENNV